VVACLYMFQYVFNYLNRTSSQLYPLQTLSLKSAHAANT
jgi:hypothetical protein